MAGTGFEHGIVADVYDHPGSKSCWCDRKGRGEQPEEELSGFAGRLGGLGIGGDSGQEFL